MIQSCGAQQAVDHRNEYIKELESKDSASSKKLVELLRAGEEKLDREFGFEQAVEFLQSDSSFQRGKADNWLSQKLNEEQSKSDFRNAPVEAFKSVSDSDEYKPKLDDSTISDEEFSWKLRVMGSHELAWKCAYAVPYGRSLS